MYSTILMMRTCHKIVHNYSWASHGSWSMQYCPMLQTIIANSELSLGTSLHLATLSHEHCPICVHFDCHFGTQWVYNIAWAGTWRWQDCSWPVVTTTVTYHIVLSTVQFVMTNVRLAWDKTRCHACIVYHRTYFIVYHLHTVCVYVCQWRNFKPERYDQCDKYNQL